MKEFLCNGKGNVVSETVYEGIDLFWLHHWLLFEGFVLGGQ